MEDSGTWLVLTPPNGGEPIRYAITLNFKATNSEADHEALITRLRLAEEYASHPWELNVIFNLLLIKLRDNMQPTKKNEEIF